MRSVYLGCVADRAGAVQRLVELWMQNSDRIEAAFPAANASLTNRALDAQWARQAEAFRRSDPKNFITTGWESINPAPVFIDTNSGEPVATEWELCTDDAALERAGLPSYANSLARHLWRRTESGEPRIVPAAPGAVESSGTMFNIFAGLMMVREFCPLSLTDWLDLLSGRAWRGVPHGRKIFRPEGVYQTLQDLSVIQSGGGHFFFGRSGRIGRLLETFHLKVTLLAELMRLVRDATAAQQLPFLNLRLESFRVSLHDGNELLPFFWSAKTALAASPESVALSVATTASRYFLPATFTETSIFRPAALSAPVQGVGEVRIREVLQSEDGATLEGTLTAQERLANSPNDLLAIRLALPSGRIDLYGNVEGAESGAAEARFRTLPQKLDAAVIDTLRQAEGVVFKNVPFQVLPVFSSPCDLYALGVLAVRALLVDDELSLPVALDETLSLARRPESSDALALRELANAEPKLRATFGPHRLIGEKWSAEEAFTAFPEDLWWECLAIVTRLFPGVSTAGFCRDYGDASPLAIERIYDEPLAALETISRKSRSMLLGDWKADREIAALLQRWPEG